MKSFTTLRTLYGNLTQNQGTNNLLLGDQIMNDTVRLMCSLRGGHWGFLEVYKDILTVASQSAYDIPNNFRRLVDLYVTVGTTIYYPQPVRDYNLWKKILAANLGDDDTAQFFHQQNGQFLLQPAPATSANTITIKGRRKVIDLGIADYSTGTIVSIANGDTVVTGSGTSWTASMAGRWIRITASDTANKGDGEWYEIDSVTSGTILNLVKAYDGTSIVAGSAAYVIGQMSVLPEPYDTAPVLRAAAMYWDQNNDAARAAGYWKQYDGGYEKGLAPVWGGLMAQFVRDAGESIEGTVMSPEDDIDLRNPNFPPSNLVIDP